MYTAEKVEAFKEIAPLIVDQVQGGAIFITIHDNRVTWRSATRNVKLDILQVGETISSNGCSFKAMRERRVLTEAVPREVYGERVSITATPIVNEKGDVTGCLSMIIPKNHPISAAFDSFAPVMAEMFPEGAFLFVTDKSTIAQRHSSKKFDLPSFKVGNKLGDNTVAMKSMRERKMVVGEYDASVYGVPVLVMSTPLFDEERGELVGAFGIILPKVAAVKLREMSHNLSHALMGITATSEELAASSTTFFANEQKLNTNVNDILKISEEINEILNFIKSIADQSKMLGLNAAIEAARAGEFGKGFGVVANEIRKMADESNTTVVKIRDLTEKIKDKISLASHNSELNLVSSEEQAAATEEITASVQEISGLAEELSHIADSI